jgi:septum formation protein
VSDASRLILASTSPYRRQLLDRLGLAYTVEKPEVDEFAHAGESPAAMSERLARAKAAAVSMRHPDAWVIGSDQVCEREGLAIGKSGDHATAVEQLTAASGKAVRFHTAVCLQRGPIQSGAIQHMHRDCTEVVFRALDAAEIERYLRAEQPYDCAGSFKCEGLGISLFERIDSEDPTALIGLPLIALARMLRAAGFQLL